MKKLFYITLFLLCSIGANAQKLAVALNGGLTPFVYADLQPSMSKPYTKQPGYYGSGRISLFLLKWQIGAAFDMYQLGVKTDNAFYSIDTKFNSMVPTVFINKVFSLPKSYLYAGLNGGANFGTSDSKGISNAMQIDQSTKYSGYCGGVQAGYTVRLIGGLAVNAEAGARYMSMKYKVTSGPAPIIQHVVFPVSFGVNYIF